MTTDIYIVKHKERWDNEEYIIRAFRSYKDAKLFVNNQIEKIVELWRHEPEKYEEETDNIHKYVTSEQAVEHLEQQNWYIQICQLY